MADQLLVNILQVTALAAGDSVTMSHGLKSNGKAVTPTQVVCSKSSPIRVSAYNATTVTFTNDSTVEASASFRVEHDFSAHAPPGTTPLVYGGLDTGGLTTLTAVDHLDFAVAPAVGGAERRLRWNNTDGTLDLGLKGGNVTLQLGQEQVCHVYNNTGADIADGRVVYQSGSTGDKITVALAQGNLAATSDSTFGVATEPIVKNSYGFVTTFGLVRDIDTNHLDEGQPIYLDAASPGLMTKTEPAPPNHVIKIGYCIRKNPTQGIIFVHISIGSHLHELHDVNAMSPRTGDSLVYNSATGLWTEGQPLWVSQTQTPQSLSAGGQITVDDTVYRPIQKQGGAPGDITLGANPIESLTVNDYGREVWVINVDATRSIILPAGGNTLLSGGVNLTLAPNTMAKFLWTSIGGGKWFQHAAAVTAT